MKIRFAFAAYAAISLSPACASEDPATVVVTATRQTTRVNEVIADVTVIDKEAIDRAGQTSLAELLGRQPGVEFLNSGSFGSQTDVMIRGGSTNQTVVLIDGIRATNATQSIANWSRIPLNQINRIEILRGPASSLYGSDAIGGVIQIFTRRGDGPPRVSAEFGYGTYDTATAAAGIAGGSAGWRYSFYAANANTKGFNNVPVSTSSGFNADADGFKNNSMSGSISYALAKGHELGVSLFDSTGRSRFDSGGTATTAAGATARAIDYVNDQTVQNSSLYSKNALTSFWTSTLRLGRSTEDSTQYNNAARNSQFRTDQNQIVWQHDLKLPVGNALLAWEYLKQGITSTTVYPVTGRTIKSLLGGWSANFGDHRLQANLRRDANSQFGSKTTGAFGYGYQFTPYWRANASYGTAFRAPTFNQLYFPAFGNPNLLPESSRNREVSLHYVDAKDSVSLTVYRNTVDNLIPSAVAVNLPTVKLDGQTLTYDGRLLSLDVQASLDYQSPIDNTGKTLNRRSRRHGNLSLGQTLGSWDWRTELTASGMRFDDVANVTQMGGYSLINLSGGYRLDSDWSLFGRVNNLFNRKYETIRPFATPGANLFVGVRYAPK